MSVKLTTQKARNGGKRTVERWKMVLWPAAVGVPVLALLIWLLVGLNPEPLTSEEILGKDEWSEQELVDTLARAFAPQSNRGARREVLAHLRRQLDGYPEEKQREIRIRALTGAIGESLRQIRAMPEVERDRMIEGIRHQAEKSYQDAQSQKGQEMLAAMRNSEEGKAFNTEVTRVVYGEFSPEERRKFAPITEIWTKTLQLPIK